MKPVSIVFVSQSNSCSVTKYTSKKEYKYEYDFSVLSLSTMIFL